MAENYDALTQSPIRGWSKEAYEILLYNGHSPEYDEAIKNLSDLQEEIQKFAARIHSATIDFRNIKKVAKQQGNSGILRILAEHPWI